MGKTYHLSYTNRLTHLLETAPLQIFQRAARCRHSVRRELRENILWRCIAITCSRYSKCSWASLVFNNHVLPGDRVVGERIWHFIIPFCVVRAQRGRLCLDCLGYIFAWRWRMICPHTTHFTIRQYIDCNRLVFALPVLNAPTTRRYDFTLRWERYQRLDQG